MATKLKAITTQYRSFVDDQVLTADQLNTLIDYFQDQGRLSRVVLNGVGIVCGFRLSVNASKEIVVSQGAGVTTDGDLIQLNQPDSTTGAPTIDIQNIKYTHYKVYEDTVVKYQPFFKNEAQLAVYELIPESQNANTDFFALSTLANVEKMVAAALSRDACLDRRLHCARARRVQQPGHRRNFSPESLVGFRR